MWKSYLTLSVFLSFSTLSSANINSTEEMFVKNATHTVNTLHTPSSCGLIDSIRCKLDEENLDYLVYLLNIFSEQKGDKVYFTTEHFEEILAKMHEIDFSKQEIETLKQDPEQCYTKIMPILSLAAKHAQMTLDEAVIKRACGHAVEAYSLWSLLSQISQAFGFSPTTTINLLGSSVIFAGSTWTWGWKSGGFALSSVLLLNMLYYGYLST